MGSLRITSGNNNQQNNNKGGSQATGIVILAFSAIIFICLLTGDLLFGGFGAVVKGFFEGVFGVTSYAICLAGILAGYLLIARRSVSIPKRYIRSFFWLFLSFVLIIHFSTTSTFLYAAENWGEYIATCYDVQNNILSGGGVIAAVVLYPIGKFAGVVGTYILLSVTTFVCVMVLTNFSVLKLFKLGNREKRAQKPQRKAAANAPKISVKKPRDDAGDLPAFWVKKAPVAASVSPAPAASTPEDRPIIKEVREGDKYYTKLKNIEVPEMREREAREPQKPKLYPEKKINYEQLFRPQESDSYLKNYEQNAGPHKSLYEKFAAEERPEPRVEPKRDIPQPPQQTRRPTIVIHNPLETGYPGKDYPEYSLANPAPEAKLSEEAKPPKKQVAEHPEFFPHKYFKPEGPQGEIIDGEKWSKQRQEQQTAPQKAPESKTVPLKPVNQLKPPVDNAEEIIRPSAQPPQPAPPKVIFKPAVTPEPKPVEYSEPEADMFAEEEYEEHKTLDDIVYDESAVTPAAIPISEIIEDATPEEQKKAMEEALSIIKPFTAKVKHEQVGINMPGEAKKGPSVGMPKIKHTKYKAPPIGLLVHIDPKSDDDAEDYEANKIQLENTLAEFKITAKVTNVVCGPTVTRYELEMAPGIPVRRVMTVADDIAMRLSSVGGIRIEAPIPGKNLFGVEVPNLNTEIVSLRSIIESRAFESKNEGLVFALGKDIGGKDVVQDLADMPHLLLAGATGQGKSVCLNALIVSLLYKYSPEELRLILVDPKMVEFGVYNGMPHLMMKDVVTTPEAAINAFAWLIKEMERRYAFFHATGAPNIAAYNAMMEGTEYAQLPRIVLVADELADLMSNHKSEIEPKILKLAAKARAAGIHLVLATQRPSVDVITGTIKTNLPYRIAMRVTSLVDSRTILDQGGSEKLIGKGDMLLKTPKLPEPVRLQGAYVTPDEVQSIVKYLKTNNETHFDEAAEAKIMRTSGSGGDGDEGDSERDKLFIEALKYCIESKSASIAMIQRRFGVGYARAGKIVEDMERLGYISGFEGSKARQIIISLDEFNQKYGGDD